MSRVPPTTIVAERTALPVFEQIRPAQIYAAWIKPTLECPNGNCKFYGQEYFEAHKKKGKKKDDKSICEGWRKCLKCSAEFHFDLTKLHECYHVTCTNCGEFKHVNHRCFIN